MAPPPFTPEQEKILAIVPKMSAGLGLPSACLLMYFIVNDHRRNGKGNSMLRALFFVSLFEALDAMAWFLSTWAVPSESGFAFAAGNQATCAFQGFWLQFVIGAPLSNCALAFYFFLVVLFNKTSKQLERIEFWLQGAIILYAVVTSFALLGLGQYNHLSTVCWVNGSPAGCGNSVYKANPDVPCERGNWAWAYGMGLFFIPLWCCILLIITFNASIYCRLQDSNEAQWFATQSLLYAVAFTVTWAPSTVWSAMHWNDGGGFALDLAAAICEPLAAFWNLLIFLRNRPKIREEMLKKLCCCLSQEQIDKEVFERGEISQHVVEHSEHSRHSSSGRTKHHHKKHSKRKSNDSRTGKSSKSSRKNPYPDVISTTASRGVESRQQSLDHATTHSAGNTARGGDTSESSEDGAAAAHAKTQPEPDVPLSVSLRKNRPWMKNEFNSWMQKELAEDNKHETQKQGEEDFSSRSGNTTDIRLEASGGTTPRPNLPRTGTSDGLHEEPVIRLASLATISSSGQEQDAKPTSIADQKAQVYASTLPESLPATPAAAGVEQPSERLEL